MSSERAVVDREGIEAALRAGLAHVPGVAGAWLFGSWATGRARGESDIDVALLLDDAHERAPRLATLRTIHEALASELDARLLHVVILDRAVPVSLAFQVLAHGRLLACGDRTLIHRFQVRVYREHGDREHVERFFREATKARLTRTAPHG